MLIIRSIEKMQSYSKKALLKGKSIGFVPTMGALHEGHFSLIRAARKDNDLTAVSIFVNPAQFGPSEDLKKYPRNLAADLEKCRQEKVDVVFYPDAKQMYPKDYSTYVSVEGLSDLLCGTARPGHFKGVATVVTKLFNIVAPTTAYFGQKDAQQSVIIKRMVKDLNLPVAIKVMPTVREKDGLALSSRNTYLNKKDRIDATALNQSLNLAKLLVSGGLRDTRRIIERMHQLIARKSSAKVEYISIVNSETLKPVKKISGSCLVALAARIGKTRLIDNLIVRDAL
jgi:pantoate--beta-alanine ligase